MSLSFSLRPSFPLTTPPHSSTRRKVFVTGAAGRIGSYFAEHYRDDYDLQLMVLHPEEVAALSAFGEVQVGDIGDLETLKRLFAGVDTVVHLAGDPSPSATWESLHETNIVGTYHVMVAAKAAGCRRVIFASSIHAVSGYAGDVQVKTGEPVNPGSLYGVTKCFGEALGRYMAEKEGLSVIALRIGAFKPLEFIEEEDSLYLMDSFVSDRDLARLIACCIDDDTVCFAILHGLSNNRFKRLDISDARELVGYQPEDDFTSLHPTLHPLHLEKILVHSTEDPHQKSGLRDET